ncbi:MAG: M17 family peptidase N-terminal domain-containing protein, partial [Gammaproteobacteria bacterium]
MEFSSKFAELPSLASGCVVVGVFDGGRLTQPARTLDQASRGQLAKLVKSSAFTGRLGQSLMLFQVPGVAAERVLLIGLGMEDEFTLRNYRKAVHKSVQAMLDSGVKHAALTLGMLSVPDADAYACARHAVECAADAAYRFEQCKSQPEK